MSEIAATDTATHDLETYRGELTGYCYRMLGSAHDADDAVQETMVRAWQAFDRFEGRSAVRSWLYRIATNVCLDMLRSRKRRALPMDLSAPVPVQHRAGGHAAGIGLGRADARRRPLPPDTDPAGRVVLQDSIRLAFISALQHLPPRQRAVLILREVLCWQAAEVADLLDTTVVSVNSALQRARTTMAASDRDEDRPSPQLAEEERDLLARYVDAFQRYDIDRLVALLHEDASISMPPFEMWMRGRDELRGWYTGWGSGCEGSRLVPVTANASPAFGQYKPSEDGTRLVPWCIQVPEITGGRISHIHHFIATDASLFSRFGLPPYLDRLTARGRATARPAAAPAPRRPSRSGLPRSGLPRPRAARARPGSAGPRPTAWRLRGGGFLDGELGGGVGLEPLVRDRLPAADRPPVGAVRQPLLGPLQGGEPVAQALRDRVVLAFGGQGWAGSSMSSPFSSSLVPVLAARRIDVRKQPLHLGPLGAAAGFVPAARPPGSSSPAPG